MLEFSFLQQLSRRNFAGMKLGVFSGVAKIATLTTTLRHERSLDMSKPRDIFTGSLALDNVNVFSHASLAYTRKFHKSLQWSTELELAPIEEEGLGFKSSTGFEYRFGTYHMHTAVRCLVTDKGELGVIYEDAMNHLASYTISATANLPEQDFTYGFGFTLNMDN